MRAKKPKSHMSQEVRHERDPSLMKTHIKTILMKSHIKTILMKSHIKTILMKSHIKTILMPNMPVTPAVTYM